MPTCTISTFVSSFTLDFFLFFCLSFPFLYLSLLSSVLPSLLSLPFFMSLSPFFALESVMESQNWECLLTRLLCSARRDWEWFLAHH